MTVVKTQALVLKKIPFGESSNIVRLYTEKMGKISVIAKGARRVKSPFRGYLDSLNIVEVIFYYKPTREIQTLSKIEFINALFRTWEDSSDITFAIAILECIEKFIHGHDSDDKIFRLIVDTLGFMDSNHEVMLEAFVYFLYHFSSVSGYHLSTNQCPLCKNPMKSALYDSANGRLVCNNCYSENGSNSVPADLLDYLKQIEELDSIKNLTIIKSRKIGLDLVNFLISHISFHLDIPVKLNSLKLMANIGQEQI